MAGAKRLFCHASCRAGVHSEKDATSMGLRALRRSLNSVSRALLAAAAFLLCGLCRHQSLVRGGETTFFMFSFEVGPKLLEVSVAEHLGTDRILGFLCTLLDGSQCMQLIFHRHSPLAGVESPSSSLLASCAASVSSSSGVASKSTLKRISSMVFG